MFGADIAGHSGIQLGEINTVEDAVATGANVAKVDNMYRIVSIYILDDSQIRVKQTLL